MTLKDEIRAAMLAIARREPIPPPRPLLIDEADAEICRPCQKATANAS